MEIILPSLLASALAPTEASEQGKRRCSSAERDTGGGLGEAVVGGSSPAAEEEEDDKERESET